VLASEWGANYPARRYPDGDDLAAARSHDVGALRDQPQPPPEELVDEVLDAPADEPVVAPPDEAAVDEPLAPTCPPEGVISHHFAPSWSLPFPLVIAGPV
jgi:hypothetical protein